MGRILDTQRLIEHWNARMRPVQDYSEGDARRSAEELIKALRTPLIVTPVAIEMLCGAQNSHELKLTRAYLAAFTVADGGRILAEDWLEARKLAERIPKSGRRRKLGDCIISAIAIRLRLEVDSGDHDMTLARRRPRK